MKHTYLYRCLLLLLTAWIIVSCGNDDEAYTPVPVSPVEMDLTQVPYDSLSKYKFFEGELKDRVPAYGVLPYDLNSTLFTDYAHKERFVWMPAGTQATYTTDGQVLDFPVGAALIKTFYYDALEEGDPTNVVETRVMIKKETGWIFADYVWNDEKTEATINTVQIIKRVGWMENGVLRQTNYRIPAANQCKQCHQMDNAGIPIGPKPQNLNRNYTYTDGSQNQLSKWMSFGYLDTAPQNIVSTVDWKDAAQPLELRVRSYLDINCAHCHIDGGFCENSQTRYAFNETTNPESFAFCVPSNEIFIDGQENIVQKQSADHSLMYYLMESTNQTLLMPVIGRTVKDAEANALIKQWIDSMESPCE
ncbi:hypothetical protein ACLI1A_14600 [Flavobacterium sp. RHBU_3]|uniref:hypothetical protein n=1 Tax=Flavobacterium sp. RHBU_3 TaxID=3391184 RepID=UPI0039849E7D